MLKMKSTIRCALAITLLLGLTACGQKERSEIKVGATVGPHAQVVEAVAKEAAKHGLTVKVVEFSDFITPMPHWPMAVSILIVININRF
jgi:D-methionine transport system substrate-binding protein